MIEVKSLKSQLWLSLLGLLTVVGLTTALFSYWYTRAEMEGFLDQQLRQFAVNLDHAEQTPVATGSDAAPHDPEDDFNVQVWDAAGNPLRPAPPESDVPRQTGTGFADTESKGRRWRTYSVVKDRQTVQVSQQIVVRQELAQDAALRALIPIGVMVPLTWLLLGFVINRVLGGLDGLVYRLSHPAPDGEAQIPASEVPVEIRPMVVAMNDLLSRLQQSLLSQKRFVADAAHELRTPLAALQLQIANLRCGRINGQSEDRLEDLERGIRRAAHLVGQLLKVARYQADETKSDVGPINLDELVKECVANVLPIADHHSQDIGIVRSDAVKVLGERTDIAVLVTNLLENAVRYTPNGGAVDIMITAQGNQALLEIADSGPGIPQEKLARVFEPFYRAAAPQHEGSGLGLAIVARIAERYGLEIELANRADAQGLIARVLFPCHEMVIPS